MLADEIEKVLQDSSRKLLQVSRPPVRFYLLTDVMGRGLDDPMVQRALEECSSYPPRIRLLERLRPDGTWPIPKEKAFAESVGPGPPVGWTYIMMLRNLYVLREYQTLIDEGHVREVLEKILSWQSEAGYIPGPTTDAFPLPHYNGFALRMLLGYGMGGDSRVERIIKWLLKSQRQDGGWLIPYVEDMKYLPQYKSMKMREFVELVRQGKVEEYDPADYRSVPSCIWTTVMVLRPIGASFKLAARPEAKKAVDFVLDRFFKKNYHPTFHRSENNWTKLKYPSYLACGLLALDVTTWLGAGADDPRLEKPIAWLLSARNYDGLWSQSDRPHPEKDQWISEIALSILGRYAKSLRGEPFGWVEDLEAGKGRGDAPL